jgi:hypothetical protein
MSAPSEEERQQPPQGSVAAEFLSSMETGEDASQDAKQFVRLDLFVKDGFCEWRYFGKMYRLRSIHLTRQIGVMVEVTWRYNGELRRKTERHDLNPVEEREIGCNIPGPTRQKFTRRILTAFFLS